MAKGSGRETSFWQRISESPCFYLVFDGKRDCVRGFVISVPRKCPQWCSEIDLYSSSYTSSFYIFLRMIVINGIIISRRIFLTFISFCRV